MSGPLLILGQSVRGPAFAAARAGYEPWCLTPDPSADLGGAARVLPCESGAYPMGLLALLRQAPAEAPVLLAGDLENHPQVVEAIAFERDLFGGATPDAIKQARSPQTLSSLPPTKGLKLCQVQTKTSLLGRVARMVFGVWGTTKYLHKPIRGWQGRGIDWWQPGRALDGKHYLQQFIKGMPMSAAFTADGWSCATLGVVELLVGEETFGAEGFETVGAVGPVKLSEKANKALAHLGVVLTQRLDLRGVFGVDLVMDWRGNLWPVEINPRFPLAAEVLDRSGATVSLNRASAKQAGKKQRKRGGGVWGCAVVRSRQGCTASSTLAELAVDGVELSDRPASGATIAPGGVLCRVEATATTRDACVKQLEAGGKAVLAAASGSEPAHAT